MDDDLKTTGWGSVVL